MADWLSHCGVTTVAMESTGVYWIPLYELLSDVTGQTGQRFIDAILAGEQDPAKLAELRDPKCKRDVATIALALPRNWRDEHLFSLRQAVELYRIYQQKIADLDQRIEHVRRRAEQLGLHVTEAHAIDTSTA